MFYRLFLSDACLGKACYEKCKYKYDKSSADIRIGDLWGKTYEKEEKGVSGAIAFTEKGIEILNNCNCELIEHSFDTVAEGQMKTVPNQKSFFIKIRHLVVTSADISTINIVYMKYLNRHRNKNRLLHPIRTIKNLIKKLEK